MLDTFAAPGRFWRGNIHTHSDRSDGALPPAEVCARYRAEGYDFLALTDHFMEKFDFPVTDTTGARDESFTTILGAELHAPENSRGDIWHILAVGLPGDFAPAAPDETGVELARRALDAGAFVAIPHPHWSHLTEADVAALSFAHAMELYNHTSAVNCDRGDGVVLYDAALMGGHRMGAIATDDAHFHADDGFGGWVMVKAETNSPEALLAALKTGHYYASQGPDFLDIHRDGDELVLTTSPVRTLLLNGPGTGSVRLHGAALTEARLPVGGFSGWCRATAIDAEGRRAWTGPLWLD